MKYLSVCSGIEAATVAWHHMGWKPLAFSEIEKFPRKVLAHHYPDVPCHGDFTTLKNEQWIKDADVLVGGTPCQAFSVAGLRHSLSDDRGNLSLEFVRLANAIDNLRVDRGRTIILWENVPGVLSVKDNAFGCFLAAIVGNDTTLIPTGGKWTNAGMAVGPQRFAAWRVLDAQYFGVPQRRRRLFVVASARNGFSPAEVLFEHGCLQGDIAKSKDKEKAIAFHASQDPIFGSICPALGANMVAGVLVDNTVRKLTPREWERLQGFPDDYTLIDEKTADGPRYKALGNSMAVPVMRWIGERIARELANGVLR